MPSSARRAQPGGFFQPAYLRLSDFREELSLDELSFAELSFAEVTLAELSELSELDEPSDFDFSSFLESLLSLLPPSEEADDPDFFA